MLVVLSLSMTSSFAVASHSVDERLNTSATVLPVTVLPVTLFSAGPTNTTTATPPGGAQHPTMSPSSTATSSTTTASSPPTKGRDIYLRGHRIQHGDRSRPDTEADRSIYDGDDGEQRSNRTTKPRENDDAFRRRRFHLISAAQVNCMIVAALSHIVVWQCLMIL